MNDVHTHMRVQDAIETAILDRGVEPPADLADIVFAAARAALETAPSSLQAELAEAKAEIARRTAVLEQGRSGWDECLSILGRATDQLAARNLIVEAATALVEHQRKSYVNPDGTLYHRWDADKAELWAALVAAVEEGNKT